jgi:hypothetical protein
VRQDARGRAAGTRALAEQQGRARWPSSRDARAGLARGLGAPPSGACGRRRGVALSPLASALPAPGARDWVWGRAAGARLRGRAFTHISQRSHLLGVLRPSASRPNGCAAAAALR